MSTTSHAARVSPVWALASLLGLASLILFADAMTKELHGTPTFYASLVRELVESGDPLYIFRGAEAYFLKPPLVLWLSALSVEVFGFTNFAVTLMPRLGGLVAVLLTYSLSRKLTTPTVAWWAALVLATNSTFIQFTTTLRMDSVLLVGLLLSLIGWFDRDCRWGAPLLFAGLTLGVLAKGPLGLAPVALLGLYCSVTTRAALREIDWRWSVLLLPAGAWYGYLLLSYGAQPMTDLAADVARPDAVAVGTLWRSYLKVYWLDPALRYWPWLPFMLAGMAWGIRTLWLNRGADERAPLLKWLALWVLGVYVMCALKPDHDIRYLYPALPALALLAGLVIERVLHGRGLRVMTRLVLAAALIGWAGVLVFGWANEDTRPSVAGIKSATDALRAAGRTPLVIGDYPLVPGTPRRQNSQRDWVHFYLGVVPRIQPWTTIKDGAASGEPLLLTVRSRGYREQLQQIGFKPIFITKEMVMAVPQ